MIKKIFNNKVRTLLSLLIIVFGSIYLINYIFYTPSYVDTYTSSNNYETPANEYFDDDKFYNCVVDDYNSEKGTSIDYETSLTDEQLSSLNKLNCLRNGITSTKGLEKLTGLTYLNLVSNQITEIDLSKNTKLETLLVGKNKLTSLDVSKNTKLRTLGYSENPFLNIYVLVNEEISFGSGLILPDGWTTSLHDNTITPTEVGKRLVSEQLFDSEKELVFPDGNVFSDGVGMATVYYILAYDVVSDKYIIKKDKIFIGKDSNEEILNNVTIDYGDIPYDYRVLTEEIVDNKLFIKYNDGVIKEFDLFYLNISDYSVDNDNGIISMIPINTSIDVFKGKLDTNISYSIKDKNDNVITNSMLKTGDKVVFDNNSIYNLSVLGDVNGDGNIDISDVVMVVNHYTMSDKKLDGAYFLAGDIDNNNDLDISDVIKIVNYYTKGSDLK